MSKISLIEIGCNCCHSLLFRKDLNLNIYNSPFKWTLTHDLQKSVILPIKEKFDNFIGCIPDKKFKTLGSVTYVNKYNVHFPHEKVIKISEDEFIIDKQSMHEKYNRRIERFYDIIKNSDSVFLLRSTREFYNDNFKVFNDTTCNIINHNELNLLQDLCNILKEQTKNNNINFFYFNTEEDYINFKLFVNKNRDNIIYADLKVGEPDI